MGAYRRFDDDDIYSTKAIAHPKTRVYLSASTWYGNTGVSGTLSLYGGVRSIVSPSISISPVLSYEPLSYDTVRLPSGSYPITGSISDAELRVTTEAPSTSSITSTVWYDEHFAPIENLYEYYSRMKPSVFITGSYDYYSFVFMNTHTHSGSRVIEYSGSSLSNVTSSFSMQAWAKPLLREGIGGPYNDMTLMSQRNRFKIYVDRGNSNRWTVDLYGSDKATPDFQLSASVSASDGKWQHLSFVFNNNTGSLYFSGSLAASGTWTGSLAPFAGTYSTTPSHYTVGGWLTGTVDGDYIDGFVGFVHDTRVWSKSLSAAEISGNYGRSLSQAESTSASLKHYSRFNDGPLSVYHGFAEGSGVFEYGRSGIHGQVITSNLGQVYNNLLWHKNDNNDFVTFKTVASGSTKTMRVFNVPSLYYGRQIATGSVELICRAYDSQGIVRIIRDDGIGGLYLSGSVTRNSSGSNESYRGIAWNKVGNVFYNEGLIVLTEPSLIDFGRQQMTSSDAWSGHDYLMEIKFDGVEIIPSVIFACRVNSGDANYSLNSSFARIGDSSFRERVRTKNDTWATAIGIFNENRELVGVAKLAQPIRIREKDRITFRPKMDF